MAYNCLGSFCHTGLALARAGQSLAGGWFCAPWLWKGDYEFECNHVGMPGHPAPATCRPCPKGNMAALALQRPSQQQTQAPRPRPPGCAKQTRQTYFNYFEGSLGGFLRLNCHRFSVSSWPAPAASVCEVNTKTRKLGKSLLR